jgi:Flp pilus assembly protein TadG
MKTISDETRQALVDVRRMCHSAALPVVSVKARSICERIRAHVCASNEGGALVEFAVVLPILLLTLMGIFTFGIAMNNYNELTESVNNGARLLAISRGLTSDPCATTVAAIYAAAPSLPQLDSTGKLQLFTFSFVLNGTSYPNKTSCTAGVANLMQGQGHAAEVTVTYPCNLSVYGTNFAPNCKLQAQTTELIQ